MCVCHSGLRQTFESCRIPSCYATQTGKMYMEILGRHREKEMVGKNKGDLVETILEEEKEEEEGGGKKREKGKGQEEEDRRRRDGSPQLSNAVLCLHSMSLLYAKY